MRWLRTWKRPGHTKAPNQISELLGYPDRRWIPDLEEAVKELVRSTNHPPDLVIKRIHIDSSEGSARKGAVLYIDGLADKVIVHQFILQPVLQSTLGPSPMEQLETEILTASSIKPMKTMDDAVAALLASATLLLVDGQSYAFSISTEGWEHRNVSTPVSEPSIRGPQDAFNEVMRMNTALLRRRIKDPNLVFEQVKVGRRSLTDVTVAYLNHVAHPKLIKEIKRRLNATDVDGVQDSGQLADMLEDTPLSPFPQVLYTERIDKISAGILEGRAAVLVDGTPFALMMPVTFSSFLYASDDYYGKYTSATFIRFLRLLALLIAIFLPSIYVALITFHQEMVPTELMLAMAANRSQVPFPAFVEALIMETSLELLREASLRMPGNMGQTIGIVGALVIGQAAVEAGLVGPVLTIIVSFTAIGSFVIPNYNASIPLRLTRFPIMLLSATFGLFGILFGAAILLIHLLKLRSFGVPYMASFLPESISEIDDSILLRKPFYGMKFRPSFLKLMDKRRRGGNK